MAASLVEDFARRVSSFRAQDDEKLQWMNAAQAQLTEVVRKYNDSCNDLERERIAGRETQKRATELESRLLGLQKSVEDSSFVLVLIDADADEYIFQDEFYQGHDGGRKAAWNLQTCVKDYFEKSEPDLASMPVVVKAFANGDGLSKFLANSVVTKHSTSLWDFAKGFSQSHALSDFVLVGNGRDRADKKIKGVFEQFVRNPTCRHIIFGACHDNGYVRMLEDFAFDSTVVDRITLLLSFNVGQEFKKLPFRCTRMEKVFRTTLPSHLRITKAVSYAENPRVDDSRLTTRKTWAALAGSDRTSDEGVAPIMVERPPRSNVLVNEQGHRIDEALPQPSPSALDSWNHKVKVANMRYCRMYHLNDSCQGECGYSHGPLSDGEKLVYRVMLRGEVCHTGLKCRDAKCHYRHNCLCKKQRCKFPVEMHGIDRASAKVWIS
ncbi:hypothetical protein FB567DRAFT_531213 [Paraphoma chrysanthemicola]|uniref:C3H1-type domain-containing protein n=1 Tax=Paraphoma chrysanthemicola TaxID=798071 RepID=A0A8K0VW55_9PLEO|nr:hypothetical protein FB567DRAFT_531213 [Paraphoma chrysanthemicola]